MTRYMLAQHVHLCMAGDHAVFLDLQRDAYFALPKAQADALADVVCDWPRAPVSNPEEDSSRQERRARAVRALLDKGLLTVDPLFGKNATPIAVKKPDIPLLPTALLHTLLDESCAPRPHIRAADITSFLASLTSAATRLRCSSLENIVLGVRSRRPRGGSTDLERMRSLVQKYRLIRPFFYTSMDRCLLDSCVLVDFLSRYDLHPLWVFGVRTRPFAAHCWVQEGPFVLNDTPEHAGLYTPIMTA